MYLQDHRKYRQNIENINIYIYINFNLNWKIINLNFKIKKIRSTTIKFVNIIKNYILNKFKFINLSTKYKNIEKSLVQIF